MPVRHREDRVLKRLASRLPLKMKENALFNDPHVKTNLLLQAHFSRFALPADLQSDQEQVLRMVPRLISACVDVLSSSSWLEPALAAMELSQMVTQAMWATDPLLRQLPHVSSDVLKRASTKEVESIFELTDLEDEDRDAVLGMNEQQLADVARFCNRYPNVALDYKVEDAEAAKTHAPVFVSVSLDRDEDEPDDAVVGPVIAPFFPQRKEEAWWLVIGQPSKNQCVGQGRGCRPNRRPNGEKESEKHMQVETIGTRGGLYGRIVRASHTFYSRVFLSLFLSLTFSF